MDQLDKFFKVEQDQQFEIFADYDVGLLDDPELLYGEVDAKAFAEILIFAMEKNWIRQDMKVFYDIGCGAGSPVFASAMIMPFLKSAIGIEILKERLDLAYSMLEKFNSEIKSTVKIEFLCQDLRKVKWFEDADILFLTSARNFPLKSLNCVQNADLGL
jgi:predicted RNA methylase